MFAVCYGLRLSRTAPPRPPTAVRFRSAEQPPTSLINHHPSPTTRLTAPAAWRLRSRRISTRACRERSGLTATSRSKGTSSMGLGTLPKSHPPPQPKGQLQSPLNGQSTSHGSPSVRVLSKTFRRFTTCRPDIPQTLLYASHGAARARTWPCTRVGKCEGTEANHDRTKYWQA